MIHFNSVPERKKKRKKRKRKNIVLVIYDPRNDKRKLSGISISIDPNHFSIFSISPLSFFATSFRINLLSIRYIRSKLFVHFSVQGENGYLLVFGLVKSSSCNSRCYFSSFLYLNKCISSIQSRTELRVTTCTL